MAAGSGVRAKKGWPPQGLVAWWLTVTLLASLCVAAARVTPASDPPELDRFLPNAPGTTWIFAEKTNGVATGVRVSQITGMAMLLTGPAVVLESRYDNYLGLGPRHFVNYFARKGQQWQLVHVRAQRDSLNHSTVPPWPVYEAPMLPGMSWSYEGQLGRAAIRFETRVLGHETLTVLGRTFSDCPYLVTEVVREEAEGSSSQRVEEWVCPETGTVRVRSEWRDLGLTLEEELVEFHGPRFGAGAALPAVTAATTPVPGEVPGIDGGRSSHVPGARLQTSSLAWSETRTSTVDFPPVGRGDIMVLAENSGLVSATNMPTGSVLWRLELPPPVAAQPVIAGSAVLLADVSRTLWAFDLQSGVARWSRVLGDVVVTAPVVVGDTVIVVTQDRRVTGLTLEDATQRWQRAFGEVLDRPLAATVDSVLVTQRSGQLSALDPTSGSTRWSASVSDAVMAGPVVSGSIVVAADSLGQLHAFDVDDGQRSWAARSPEVIDVPPAMSADRLVTVARRRLQARETASGELRWDRTLAEPVRFAPLILGESVVVLTTSGRLVRYALADGRVEGETRLRGPDPSVGVEGNRPMAYVGTNLVITLDLDPPWGGVILLAYDARAAGSPVPAGPPAVPISARRIGLGGLVTLPPEPAGDQLVVGYIDGSVGRIPSSGDGPTVQVASPGRRVLSVGRGRGVVVVHREGELLGIGVDGRTGWSVELPSLDPQPAATVSAGTVFVATGTELAAYALSTGAVQWRQTLGPLRYVGWVVPLPDGDLLLSSDTIYRVDGRTGNPRWVLPITGADSGAAVDGIVVLPILVLNEAGNAVRGRALLAVDAATGAVRWEVPFAAQVVTAGNGLVVAVDFDGVIATFDARTGRSLWATPLRTLAGGPPAIVGNRVVVAQEGRWEDASQRDFRVSVFDAPTGRYLAGVEIGEHNGGRQFSVSEGQVLVPRHSDLVILDLLA